MTVAGLRPRHREIGRLRLGTAEPLGKGRKGSRPKSIDSWRLTSAHLDVMHAAAKLWGGEVADWQGQYELITDTDSLQVLVPDQDIEAGQYLEEWSGGGILRRCDGTTELIGDQPCLRDADKPCECTIVSHLLVVLPEVPDMGVWRLTTRGWNAAAELPEAVRMVRLLTETGRYQLPHAELGIEHRTKKVGGETHTFVVPVLRLPYTLAEAGLGASASRPGLPAGVDPETGEIVSAPLGGERRLDPPVTAQPNAATRAAGGADTSPASTKKQGAGTSSPAGGSALGKAPAGEDTTVPAPRIGGERSGVDGATGRPTSGVGAGTPSGEGKEQRPAGPVSSTREHLSPDVGAREGEELREQAGSDAGQTPDVEYPSRRPPCLHTKGMEQRGKYNCCVECGSALEKIA